ncbi:MAG: hypothetical protein ABSH24_18350 [Bryobacteraceae bacterium]
MLYRKGALHVTVELIDVRAQPEAPARLLPGLARLGRESGVTFAVVEEGKRGLRSRWPASKCSRRAARR